MWRTIGHQRTISTLERGFREGRLSHAYLLTGPPGVGKMLLAVELAQMVNCLGEERPCGQCGQCQRIASGLHADVRVVAVETQTETEGRSRTVITIGQVREVQREASLKPFEGRCRVFIFDGAEYMREDAANCLLKTLEEPPDQVMLVLLASDASTLLPTILSRCQCLDLKPLPLELVASELMARYQADAENAKEVARLSGGRPGWAFRAMSEPELLERRAERLSAIEAVVHGSLEERFEYASRQAAIFLRDREAVRQELDLWLGWWRDVLVVKEGAPDFAVNLSRLEALKAVAGKLSAAQVVRAIRAVQEALEHLERNVNSRLALDNLVLALPRP